MPFASNSNFDNLVKENFSGQLPTDPSLKLPVRKRGFRKRKIPDVEKTALEFFQSELVDGFQNFYKALFPNDVTLDADDVFGKEEADSIGLYLHQINTKEELWLIIGGEFVFGQLDWLLEQITQYKSQFKEEI